MFVSHEQSSSIPPIHQALARIDVLVHFHEPGAYTRLEPKDGAEARPIFVTFGNLRMWMTLRWVVNIRVNATLESQRSGHEII
jgi:hypothetical protein